MKNLGYHTHIISMLGCVSCPQNPMILVEYCEYGDLLHFLRNNRNHVIMCKDDVCPTDADICLRIKDLVSIAWQVSDGMTYLSSKNFIHRDVAARNVLLTKQLVAKVSDFGLGRYADSALYTARGGRLPFKSMAVEALKFYEFSEKTDVWAFGILLFEIFSLGDVPYPTVQPTDMISYIEQGNRPPQPEKCPNEIFGLMERCWKAIPDDRPIFAEIRGELTILLNIDDESYGYLSLDSRQLRNMFNRQISELHSNPIKDDNSKELGGKQMTQTNEKNTLVGSGRSNFLTVSPSQDQNIGPNTGAIVSTNSKTAGEFDDSTTKYQAQKNSAKPTSFAAKESMTNLRAQSSSNDDIMYKSGMRKNTGDVSILLENIVNFSLQMPEDKRTDCIQSMEQWMNNKLSNGS
ncbi:protein tyrosine kinase [Necator americanus]|uniref:Protein tyrosine kinase n=1 Tax=Necator americanus TaxID=51031 RepID=W2SQX8_NECAM|nr:protein tyrosine kinase [Necator americanus]ETN71102.1 protein tyrosine kinase [Necator americanus]